MDNLLLGVVILNYSTPQDTIRLVEQLQRQTISEQIQVVVVDNCSPDDSFERLKPLKQRFRNVELLQTGENLGYARGNNFGLRFLECNPPRYVVVLNSDVSLPEDSLEQLVQSYEKLDKVAFIAPVMVDEKGHRSQVYKVNNFAQDVLSLLLILRVLFPVRRALVPKAEYKGQVMECDMVVGSFIFANFDLFRSLGYFYPNTFLYAEERFLYHKTKTRGLKNYIILDQSYLHEHKSPSIDAYHNRVSKYRLLYSEWLEYTRVCRGYGALKALILRPLIWWSLCEWRLMGWLKRIKHNG